MAIEKTFEAHSYGYTDTETGENFAITSTDNKTWKAVGALLGQSTRDIGEFDTLDDAVAALAGKNNV